MPLRLSGAGRKGTGVDYGVTGLRGEQRPVQRDLHIEGSLGVVAGLLREVEDVALGLLDLDLRCGGTGERLVLLDEDRQAVVVGVLKSIVGDVRGAGTLDEKRYAYRALLAARDGLGVVAPFVGNIDAFALGGTGVVALAPYLDDVGDRGGTPGEGGHGTGYANARTVSDQRRRDEGGCSLVGIYRITDLGGGRGGGPASRPGGKVDRDIAAGDHDA